MSTILIIGAGPNIGLAVAETFSTAGYKVALASRNKKSDHYKHFYFDATKPETVPKLFDDVRRELGDPKVVVYNAAARTETEPDAAFSLSLDDYRRDMDVNATSVYAAAKEAVAGFARTGPGSTFIFTGNKLNVWGREIVLVFGMGKSATAHLIRAANAGFEGKGYKFYYVDQRQPDGGISLPTGAKAHATTFLELAQDEKQRSWHYTFVDGRGYVDFHER